MTISRVNLCLRPALKTPGTGAPNWVISGTGTDWGRITTGVHATLPRTTALAGTQAVTFLYSAAAPVVPGRTYIGSVHMRAIAANNVNCYLAWFLEDGSTFIPPGGFTNAYNQAAGTTVRMNTPASVAPAGAVCARVAIGQVDGAAQFTGAMIEQAAALGTYFDGDTAGARWTGADGASYSAIGTSDLAGVVDYDDERGRIRAFAQGAAAIGGRVRVLRRGANRAVFDEVRGANAIGLTAGASVRSADDYEHPDVEGGLVYRLETYSGAAPLRSDLVVLGTTEPVLEAVELAFTPPGIRAWLKFVAAPRLNRKVTITGWGPLERPDRNQLYDVDGRTDPIVVTSGHSSRRTVLTLRTWTRAETDALDESLRQGIPGFLHLPGDVQLPTMYVVFGAYQHRPASRRSQGAIWEIPVVEVAAPPASIFAAGNTWQTVLDTYATWTDLFGEDEWRRVTS